MVLRTQAGMAGGWRVTREEGHTSAGKDRHKKVTDGKENIKTSEVPPVEPPNSASKQNQQPYSQRSLRVGLCNFFAFK